jgi:hypothetical protein
MEALENNGLSRFLLKNKRRAETRQALVSHRKNLQQVGGSVPQRQCAFPRDERKRARVRQNKRVVIRRIPFARVRSRAINYLRDADDAAEHQVGRQTHAETKFDFGGGDLVRLLRGVDDNWPATRVGHVRFSMSLMPVTMSAAYGCRMLITFIASSD